MIVIQNKPQLPNIYAQHAGKVATFVIFDIFHYTVFSVQTKNFSLEKHIKFKTLHIILFPARLPII